MALQWFVLGNSPSAVSSLNVRVVGMAMRLAFDLGLHIDMAPYVRNGSITAAEAELRRMVFWGTYALDQ